MIEFLLAAAVAILAVSLGLAVRRINEMEQEVIGDERAIHAKCIAHMAHYVGNEHAAMVLRQAAEDYDSVTQQPYIQAIARNHEPAGPSVPALWLTDRAKWLSPVTNPAPTLNGERVL